jgi:hypothetical protein
MLGQRPVKSMFSVVNCNKNMCFIFSFIGRKLKKRWACKKVKKKSKAIPVTGHGSP